MQQQPNGKTHPYLHVLQHASFMGLGIWRQVSPLKPRTSGIASGFHVTLTGEVTDIWNASDRDIWFTHQSSTPPHFLSPSRRLFLYAFDRTDCPRREIDGWYPCQADVSTSSALAIAILTQEEVWKPLHRSNGLGSRPQ